MAKQKKELPAELTLKREFSNREYFTLSGVPSTLTIQGVEYHSLKNRTRLPKATFVEVAKNNPDFLKAHQHYFNQPVATQAQEEDEAALKS